MRGGAVAFDGSTTLAAMKRSFADLASWLGRETSFPDGVVLLTGTGVVPPDEFTLAPGDEIDIRHRRDWAAGERGTIVFSVQCSVGTDDEAHSTRDRRTLIGC